MILGKLQIWEKSDFQIIGQNVQIVGFFKF